MSDVIDGLILGAAAAAIGTIVAMKFINERPIGDGQPYQEQTAYYGSRNSLLSVPRPVPNDASQAPLAFNLPITEAAYNQYPTAYAPAFGPAENQPQLEVVLPV